MKILIVRMFAEELNIYNYNCQEIGLAKSLVKKGNTCDVVLYTSKKESYEEDYIFANNQKIHIYYLRAKKFLNNCFYEKKLFNIVSKYDVVQTTEYDQIANFKLKKYCKKMVIYHGPYRSNFTWKYNLKCLFSDLYYLLKRSYKETQCIAKSSLAEQFLRKKGFKNVMTIGVGLNIDNFNYKSNNVPIQLLQLHKEKKENKYIYLLYVGKIEIRRNTLFLIKLMNEIVKCNDNVKLIIVGKGKENYVKKCKKNIKKYNLSNNIIIIDSLKQAELPYLYEMSDLFLFPTKYDIFGMVLLEANYFNLPYISTLNGGSSMIEDGNYMPLKVNIWKSKILEKIELFNKQISLNKKNDFKYTWEKLSKRFLDVYKK